VVRVALGLLLAAVSSQGWPEPVRLISEIQGRGAESPLVGRQVTVDAIVVGDFQRGVGSHGDLRGFFIQEEDADTDNDPRTSEGLFVFDGPSPSVDVTLGDRVAVTGTVTEYYGLTELTDIRAVKVISRDNPLPAPGHITLNSDTTTIENADGQLIANLEAFEGMRVRLTDTLTITEMFNLDRFGEMTLSVGGRPVQFTQHNAPSEEGHRAHQQEVSKRRIILDDGQDRQNPARLVHLEHAAQSGIVLRMGTTMNGLTGVLTFSKGSGAAGMQAYRVHPTETKPAFTAGNPRPLMPPDVGGDIKVAVFNVLNFFTTLDNEGKRCGPRRDMGCRGADSQLEYQRQLNKLVAAITQIEADILGIVEVENTEAGSGLRELVTALNGAMGSTIYAFIDTDTVGSDAIRVGLLYRVDALVPAGEFAILDQSVDPRFLDTKNRPVLLQTFDDAHSGERFSVAVVHLKSKGSPCDDVQDPNRHDGQGNCNRTRTQAVHALHDWLASDPTASGDTDVILMGDFNAYAGESPITTLEQRGWQRQSTDYSYVYDGQLGTLDYIFVSESLRARVTGAGVWHINADEPDALDYNTDFGRSLDLYAPHVYRSSDHDPIIMGLSTGRSGSGRH
jgi:hypothetical protein